MQETQETRVWFRGQEDNLEKEMATHSSILAWGIPRTEEPRRLQSMGSSVHGGHKKLDTTEAIEHACTWSFIDAALCLCWISRVRSPQDVSRAFEVLWTELFKIYSPKSTWIAYNSASWRHNHRAELYIPYAKGTHWIKRCINVYYAEKSDVNFLTCSQWESVTVNTRFSKS